MKLAIIKIGGRITANANGATGGEVLHAVELLLKGGNDIHCFTTIIKNDKLINGVKIRDILQFDVNEKFDALIVINGNINFYGGVTSDHEMQNLKIINSFKGKVVYMLFDPMLPLKQYWDGIETKQEKYNWKKKYSKEEIYIERDDIIYISQPYDLEAVNDLLLKTGVKHSKIYHYPLYKMHLTTYDRFEFKEIDREVDISYGGTFRNKKRESKLIKFYFHYPEEYKVEIFGKIELEQFSQNKIRSLRPPKFCKGVSHDMVRDRMSKSLSTIVIGDKWYEGRNLAQRIYENILSNTITFIDKELDPKRLVYGSDDPFFDQLYVSSKDEVIELIEKTKLDKKLIKHICNKQYEAVQINKQEYINNLTNLIGEA